MKNCFRKNSLSKPKLNNNRFEDKKPTSYYRCTVLKFSHKTLAETKQNYEI